MIVNPGKNQALMDLALAKSIVPQTSWRVMMKEEMCESREQNNAYGDEISPGSEGNSPDAVEGPGDSGYSQEQGWLSL